MPGPVAEGEASSAAVGAVGFLGVGAAGFGAGWGVFVYDRPRGVFRVGGGEGAGVWEIRVAGVGGGNVFLSEDRFSGAVGGRGEADVEIEGEG